MPREKVLPASFYDEVARLLRSQPEPALLAIRDCSKGKGKGGKKGGKR